MAVLRTLDLILSMKINLLELSGSFNADLNTTGPKQSMIRKKREGSEKKRARRREQGGWASRQKKGLT